MTVDVTASFNIQDLNEQDAYNKFSSLKNQFGTIILKSGNKTIVLDAVYKIDFVGGQKSGRGVKSDFIIYYNRNKKFNVSLKERSFKSWESADSLIGDAAAEKILTYLMEDLYGTPRQNRFDIKVTPGQNTKSWYTITRRNTNTEISLAFKTNVNDCKHVVFGDDILNQGAVVSHNFNDQSSIQLQDRILTITVHKIIQSVAEISDNDYPYFQIGNTSKKRNLFRFPGLRVQAKPKSELGSSIILSAPLR